MSQRIIAIMPIKMENERLPGKNIKQLGDKPLLQWELDQLLRVHELESIYVYCSNETICDYLPAGVVYKKRPEFLDLPESNFTQIFDSFKQEEKADIYVYAHATAPFITLDTMKQCIDAVSSGKYDSAFCAVKIQDYLWQDGKPLNFDATNMPRSQDLLPIYRETSGVYVFTDEVFAKYQRRIGVTPFVKEVTYKEAVDINTREDFKLAEALLNADL